MSNINHETVLDKLPYVCKNYKKNVYFEIFRTSEIIYKWEMSFFDIESTIEEMYRVVSYQIKLKMSDFHLFVCKKSLALDFLNYEGYHDPFEMDINEMSDFKANVSNFRWQFDRLAENDIGIIDKTKTLLYERVQQLGCNLSMEDDQDIKIIVVFPSDLNNISQKVYFPTNELHSWTLPKEIVSSNPINPIFQQLISISRNYNENYIKNLFIEQLHWKWSNEIENRYFDLYKLKELFVLTNEVPFIQFINFSGKQNIDLQSSSISILSDYLNIDNFELLQKWENQSKQKN